VRWNYVAGVLLVLVLVGLFVLDVLDSSLGGWLVFAAILALALMRLAGWYPALPPRRAR
jgi:hypothetical protein